MNRTAHDSKIRRNSGTFFGMSNYLSIALSLVFISLSGLLVVNSVKSVSTAYQRSLLLDQAEAEVNELRIRNLELLEKLDYVTSSSYVEAEARNRLLYTKDGEVLLVLPQTAQNTRDNAIAEEEDPDATMHDISWGWDRWWVLLRDGV